MAKKDPPASQLLSEILSFPVGTVSLYGPNAARTTKIVAEILFDPHGESLRRSWIGSEVATNPKVLEELAQFMSEHQPTCILASEHNVSCIHVAGEDFPLGENCPFCPYWTHKSKQTTMRAPEA